jgi:hypothetical protein
LDAAGLEYVGAVPWGTPVELSTPGVYLVTFDADPAFVAPIPGHAPISTAAVDGLLDTRPELRVDDSRPTDAELARRLSSFWLVDEPVLYIGLAGTSLHGRISQYYGTRLGARGPHAGGWFLKTLAILPSLWVHFARADDPKTVEHSLLERFVSDTSQEARQRLLDPAHPFPFANLEWPQGTRKKHGITGAREPRRRVSR